jgi:hypothetical protein
MPSISPGYFPNLLFSLVFLAFFLETSRCMAVFRRPIDGDRLI